MMIKKINFQHFCFIESMKLFEFVENLQLLFEFSDVLYFQNHISLSNYEHFLKLQYFLNFKIPAA